MLGRHVLLVVERFTRVKCVSIQQEMTGQISRVHRDQKTFLRLRCVGACDFCDGPVWGGGGNKKGRQGSTMMQSREIKGTD